jgi:alkanesulfonate monooxygenase SsuD/methylene tetrahydromethanopterin reductase-like flavin-dependent oxidoreductase (luciferase family)
MMQPRLSKRNAARRAKGSEVDSRVRHPWVASCKGRISFALQAVAAHSSGDRGAAIVRAGRQAEKYGFDAFFLGDHPAWAPECWLHLSVIASQTHRIRLGQMVAAVPYRTPLLTARLQSDLDRLSAGRSILGLGIGWNAADYGLGSNEFDRMGIAFQSVPKRQTALEEAVAIIRGTWGLQPFSLSGQYYRAAQAQVDPPVQSGGVPLVIAGSGQKTLGQVARLGDIANFGPGPAGNVDTVEDAQERLAILEAQCLAVGRPYDDILRSHFTHWLILASDEQSLAAKITRYFPDGRDPFWGKYLIAGTPEQAAVYFQGFVDAGIEHFVIQTLDPDDEESLELIMSELGPRLRISAPR